MLSDLIVSTFEESVKYLYLGFLFSEISPI